MCPPPPPASGDALASAEARAADAERSLRLAGKAARLGSWRVRLADGLVDWSDTVAAIHGMPPGFAPGFDEGIALFAPDHREAARQAFDACAQDGIPFNDVRQIVDAAGTRVWVRSIGEAERDAQGRIVAVHGVMQDISNLMEARQEAVQLSARLLGTFESIRDAFLTLDRDWRFTLVNSEAARQLDCDRRSMIGQRMPDLFPQAAQTGVGRVLERAMHSGRTVRSVEFSPRLKKWFDITAYPSPDGLSVYFLDVTEQKAQGEHLRLLETAVSRQTDALVITAAETPEAAAAARIIYVNDAFTRMTGYPRDETIGNTPRMLQGPRTRNAELSRIRQAIGGGNPVRAELINYTRAGREFWVELDITPIRDESGRLTHFVSVQRDITERKKAESEARMMDERFRLAAAATSDVIWDWDIAANRLWWSDTVRQVYGYDPAPIELDFDAWLDRIHPDDREQVRARHGAFLHGDAPRCEQEYRFLHEDGSEAVVLDRAFLMRDAEGRPVRMLGSMADITERRDLEARLRQSQRLQAVGQLTGGVAHDFNNLLTVILGNAEMLADRLSGAPDLQELATLMADAAERGATLTQRLLSFARKQPLQPGIVDVNSLIGRMDALLRQTLPADITIRFDAAPLLAPAMVDAGQLENAILNLVLNSRDAMPQGGTLSIATRQETLDATYARRHEELAPGDYVAIAISDTGRGMTQDVAERAFDPFFTTKAPSKGSGLGLSMVYGFVKQSRGHAEIRAEPGRGTTVTLYLPRAEGMAEAAAAESDPAHGGTDHILVVEDDPLVRGFVTAQLAALGYRVSAATSGPEALALLESNGDVRLLYTDVVIPGGMSGPELARRARARHPGLAVLLTSGHVESRLLRDDPDVAAGRLLAKPYRRADLAAKLREALEE